MTTLASTVDAAAGPGDTGVPPTTGLAGPPQVRLAMAVGGVSLAAFILCALLARTHLEQPRAVMPFFDAMLSTAAMAPAALLCARFIITRSSGLPVLAGGYAFVAAVALIHAFSVPKAFGPTGLLGASLKGATALYMIRHIGFPVAVLLYAVIDDRGEKAAPAEWRAVLVSLGVALAAAVGLTLGVMLVLFLLPEAPPRSIARLLVVACGAVSVGLCLVAICALWRRRPWSALDVWLAVVMLERGFDVALETLFHTRRFDLGWYAGGYYEFLSTVLMVVVLLVDSVRQLRRLADASQALSDSNAALETLSLQDGLTGLANRRCFDSYLASQISLAQRQKRSLALILCDVDFFKSYNDTFGHLAGDECLVRVAAALKTSVRRPADMVARYGGEEFAIVLPDAGADDAARIAEAARAAVSRLAIAGGPAAVARRVTLSGGVAILRPHTERTASQLIAEADDHLLLAKAGGRDRMVGPAAPAEEGAPDASLPSRTRAAE